MRFSSVEREEMLKKLEHEALDLLVVGGGITGAGIVRDAAQRGLKAALVEKDDFAFGTSSRSSKLVHGGLRYLEQYNFSLVFESTQERALLMRLGRHIVRPLPFLMPVWNTSRHGLPMICAGMWLYDILGTFRNYRTHRRLDRESLLSAAPGLRPEGLKGGVRYYDAVTDDGRLTLENILSAFRLGGLPVSRAELTGLSFRDQKVHTAEIRDRMTGRTLEVRTRCVICAAGPWTEAVMERLDAAEDGPKLRPTKGVHLVVPRALFPLAEAVVMTGPRDGRVMFAIPWKGATVIGTTDTDFEGDPDRVFADQNDVAYLIETARHHFPSVSLSASDVVGTWAGLRPLIREGSVPASRVSREHLITVDRRGVIAIAGGKLTTYRRMAAQAMEAALPFLADANPKPCATGRTPLPYAAGLTGEADLAARVSTLEADFHLPTDCAEHLVWTYGGEAVSVLGSMEGNRSLLERIHPALPFLRVEIPYACTHEMALTLEDFLYRRSSIFLLATARAVELAGDVADQMAAVLGWDAGRKQIEIQRIQELSDLHMASCR